MSGAVSFHAGVAAEESVAAHYATRGWSLRACRWRGRGGEIDLIVEKAGTLVFVEVKKSKSFAAAAERVSPHQVARIKNTAREYLGRMPAGQDTECRFDVALMNAEGQVEILENAFGH